MKNAVRTLPRLALSLAVTFTIPVWMSLSLNGEPVYPRFYAAALCICLAAFAADRSRSPRFRTFMGALIASGFTLYALVVVAMVVLIPFQAYRAWLNADVKPSGTIPMVLVASYLFFSAAAGVSLYRKGTLKAAAFAFVSFLPFSVLLHNERLYALCAVLAVFLVMIALRSADRQFGVSFSLFLCVVFMTAALFSAFLVKANESSRGWLSGYVLKPSAMKNLVRIFPESREIAFFGGSGVYDSESILGGEPSFSGLPLLRLRMVSDRARRVYLATQVYDLYHGTKWGHSPQLLDGFAGRSLGRAPVRHDLAIEVVADYFPAVPYPLSFGEISSKSVSETNGYIGSAATGFLLTVPLLKGDSIFIQNRDEGDVSFERGGARYETEFRREELSARDRKLYLEIRNRAKISALTQPLVSADGDAATVLNIIEWLAANCEFSLKTKAPEEGGDLVGKFLFTERKGYAVHFASAFVLMARSCGIPARYAEGVMAYYPAREESVEITPMNSHCWAEVHLAESGWVRVETVAFLAKRFGEKDPWKGVSSGKDPLTEKQLALFSGRKMKKTDRSVFSTLADWLSGRVIYALAAALGAAAACGFLYLLIGYIRTRESSDIRRVRRVLSRIVRRASRCGIPSPDRIGWEEWARRAECASRCGVNVRDVLERVERGLYAGDGFSKEDIREIARLGRKCGFTPRRR